MSCPTKPGAVGKLPSLTSLAPRTSGIEEGQSALPSPPPAFGQDPGNCMSEASIIAGA